jgi:hypothetical protein
MACNWKHYQPCACSFCLTVLLMFSNVTVDYPSPIVDEVKATSCSTTPPCRHSLPTPQTPLPWYPKFLFEGYMIV